MPGPFDGGPNGNLMATLNLLQGMLGIETNKMRGINELTLTKLSLWL
jgi:hypothetical protein